ncbi:MAG: hypothetical protein RLZZ397_480 [Pseudomonadota bacterium]|jgi:4-aminobutyrate aminotransferase
MNTNDRKEGDVNFGYARAQWQKKHHSEATHAALREDEKYFFHQALSTPCMNALKGAKGSHLVDLEGRNILDFHGNSVHQLGYGHPKVVSAIQQAMEQLPFSPRRYSNAWSTELAKRLTELAPIDDARVLFSPNGATAVSMALKIARWHTHKHKVIAMKDSFHGATLDTISVGGEEVFHRGMGPLLDGVIHVPAHEPSRCELGCQGICHLACADRIEQQLSMDSEIGAVLIETVRCTDVQIPPRDFYQRIRQACDRYGALLIVDEIPIALGRTGHWFAIQAYDVHPDLIVIGKGLGGGILPLAAVIGASKFNTAKSVSLGHFTHEKNPVLCAAGLATIDVLEEEKLIDRSRHVGREILSEIEGWKCQYPFISEVRGIGLLIGVELQDAYGIAAEDLAETVLYDCLSLGLSFKVGKGRVLVLSPSLNIYNEDMEHALKILRQVFSQVHIRFSGPTI